MRRKTMDWIVLLVMLGVLGGVFLALRLSFVPADVAQRHLAGGAVVIDVRTPAEFHSGSVPGAINVPLNELEDAIGRQVPDRARVLLVHCLSGGRSALARQQLRSLGYGQVFNLGSLARARKLVEQSSARH